MLAITISFFVYIATATATANCDLKLSQNFNKYGSVTKGYTLSDMSADWPRSEGPFKMLSPSDSQGGFYRSALPYCQVRNGELFGYFPKGKILAEASGFSWFVELTPMDSATMSYDVYFEPGFDFSYGGKLSGLAGLDAPRGCSTVSDTRGWSQRLMWQKGGGMITYAYYPKKSVAIRCGENWKWNSAVQTGRWHNIRMFVQINTAGVANGISKAWLDGKLVLDKRDVMYRMIDKPEYTITKAYITTYVGGSSVEMFAPDHDQWIKFDNFKVWKGSCTPFDPAPVVSEVYTRFDNLDQPYLGDMVNVKIGNEGVSGCYRICDGTPGCVMFTVYNGKCYLKRLVAAPIKKDGFTLYARGCGTSGKQCCFGTSCAGNLTCASGTCIDTKANVAVQSSCGTLGEECCGFYGDCDEELVCKEGNFLEKSLTKKCSPL